MHPEVGANPRQTPLAPTSGDFSQQGEVAQPPDHSLGAGNKARLYSQVGERREREPTFFDILVFRVQPERVYMLELLRPPRPADSRLPVFRVHERVDVLELARPPRPAGTRLPVFRVQLERVDVLELARPQRPADARPPMALRLEVLVQQRVPWAADAD